MIWDRRSKILYPFRCEMHHGSGTVLKVSLFATNRRTAKRLAFGYFYKNYSGTFGPIKVYHMRDKPLAIPVKR